MSSNDQFNNMTVAEAAARFGIDTAEFMQSMDRATNTPIVADVIDKYLAVKTAQTRRTYGTVLRRLRDGIGPVCDQTCEPCLGHDFVCRCECSACRSSRVSLPALGAERVSAAVFSEEHVRILATASKRIAVKKGIVDNRRRAERGKPPKAADGYGAEETAVAALRSLFDVAKKHLGGVNPALDVPKPHRASRERRPLQDFELCELYHVTSSGGDDPELDMLILDVAIATGARREGVWSLTVGQIDPELQMIKIRDKYKRTIPAPVSADLIQRLLTHARARGGSQCDPRHGSYRPDARVLWTKRGKVCTPISDRRFDTLAGRWQKAMPWANAEQLALHHIRHTMAAVLAAQFGPQYKKRYLRHAGGSVTDGYGVCTTEELARAMSELLEFEHPYVQGVATRRAETLRRLGITDA